MKAYIITTGLLFLVLAIAHISRIVAEGPRLLSEPIFVLLTAAAVAFAAWAGWLVSRAFASPRPRP